MTEYLCHFCHKPAPQYHNYCSWECHVAEAKAEGGKVHTPNGLPISCIDCDGNMWEHEHGNHPDYKFPVRVEYVGTEPEKRFACVDGNGNVVDMGPDWIESQRFETHALIYVNKRFATTLYEHVFAIWSLADGRLIAGDLWRKGEYKLTDDSLKKIAKLKR